MYGLCSIKTITRMECSTNITTQNIGCRESEMTQTSSSHVRVLQGGTHWNTSKKTASIFCIIGNEFKI